MASLAWFTLVTMLFGCVAESFPYSYGKLRHEEVFPSRNFQEYPFWKALAKKDQPTSINISHLAHNMITRIPSFKNGSRFEPLRFSDKRGLMITLSSDRRNATRDGDEGVYSLVYTTRQLEDNELFEITIEETDDNAFDPNRLFFGVTVKNPEEMERVPDGAFEIPGSTWVLYGPDIFEGDGTGNMNVITPELCPRVSEKGDRLGVIKRPNGDIHFYLNGEDCGVGVPAVQEKVYGVVDMQRITKKVRIHY